jgi:hypothetical protein
MNSQSEIKAVAAPLMSTALPETAAELFVNEQLVATNKPPSNLIAPPCLASQPVKMQLITTAMEFEETRTAPPATAKLQGS